MFGKRFFYLPMIGLTIISAVGYSAFSQLLPQWLYQHNNDNLERQLDQALIAIHQDNPDSTPQSLDAYLGQHSLIGDSRRITIIDEQGTVIADTSLTLDEIAVLENHTAREEIAEALESGLGYGSRFSATTNKNVDYVAKPLYLENFQGVIRIADLHSQLEGLAAKIEMLVILLLLIVFAFMLMLSKYINREMKVILAREQKQLGKHVEEQTREIELLHRLASMLAACNSLVEAQQVIEDIIPRILGDINGAISIIRSSRNQLEIKLDWGGEWPADKSFTPEECWALRKGKTHLANDKFSTLPCAHMKAVGSEQTMCIPLTAHGNTIGMMHLYIHNEAFDDERTKLAFTISEHLGLALANLGLQEELKEQAVRDPLTGLHNRRFLEETIDHEFMRSQRQKAPLSLLMLDMDHFKRFNDSFGHDAGDYVLKSLATLLTENIRGEDIVCRVGGEELAVLLPDTDGILAMTVAEKLCGLVRDLHLDFHGQSLGKLTLSIGVSTYPTDAQDYETLTKQADVALYQAKDDGRDRALHCDLDVMTPPQTKELESPQGNVSVLEQKEKGTTTL